MAIDEVKVDEIEDTDENIADITETETTDWKAEALKAQELARQQAGIAKRNATRLKKLREQAQKPDKKVENNKSGFDYGEKAFLKASQIPQEEWDYLFQESQATGKELDALLGFKYIQEELNSRKEQRATKEAIPSGSKRAGNASRDSVDYWLAKIDAGTATSADIPDFKLRTEVVKARIAREKQGGTFSSNPIV